VDAASNDPELSGELLDVAALRDALLKIANERDRYAHERDEYKKLYLLLLEKCKKLEAGLLGQKAERLPHNERQLTLSLLQMLLGEAQAAAEPEPEKQIVHEHERRKPTGRRPLPENLPRVEIEIVPPEVQRLGLDAFERIGEDTSETLERRPASLVVARVLRPKFVPKDRDRNAPTEVLIAPPPELPIERGLAGPGLLADTVVKRFGDHLPLNRQEAIWAREGIELSRSTVCSWHMQLGELVRPLPEAMLQEALIAPYLCTDATGVLVQQKDECRKGHFFVVVSPGLHVLMRYHERHDAAAVDRMLKGYKGYVVADAHSVYDHLYGADKATEVACWAHARRYHFKAFETDPERARVALSMIGALFKIERQIADEPRKDKEAVRREKSKPIVDRFFTWCEAEKERVLDETPIKTAIGYALNQRDALERFLDDGRLPLSNNISERELRREVVGRRNWLFVGTDEAGEVNADFVTLITSCRMHEIEPWAYLRDLLCLMPSWPKSRVLELAPAHWRRTLQGADAQERLAANVFRPLTLGPPAPPKPRPP
jgi:transposase